jgi:hypothetical protein
MSVQYLRPSPWSEVILAPGLFFSFEEKAEEEEEEGRRSIIHISKFFNITVEDILDLEVEVEGSRRITDCLRFSNRITSPGVSCDSVSVDFEGPAGG